MRSEPDSALTTKVQTEFVTNLDHEAEIALTIAASARGDDPSTHVSPPGESEKYQYLVGTFRFLPLTMGLLFCPLLISLTRFASLSPWLWVFYIWAAIQFMNLFLGAYTSNRSHGITLDSHRNFVATYRPQRWASIDVFLPTCNEPLEVLLNTYKSVSALQWPGQLTVHVMDDADRPVVRVAAEKFGFSYIVREDRGTLKKAGNLRNAFARTDGDFILVLDADFTVRPDAFFELMPYFQDESIGIVQSPQYFDVSAQQNWLQRGAGATQELFYRWIQPSRAQSNAAICVGTCAIYRRKGLEAAGGFAPIQHSEDVHTGVRLAKAGFSLKYIPVLVCKGLCPYDLYAFVSQQYRWATGSMSLMVDKSFYGSSEFTFRRIAPYFTGFFYYLTTGIGVFISNLPAPIMLWFFPEQVKAFNYLPLLGVVFSQCILLPIVTNRRYRPAVIRVQMLYSFAHAQAIYDAIRSKTTAWVPTGAGKSAHNGTRKIIRTMKVVLSLSLLTQIGGIAHVLFLYGLNDVWPAILVLFTMSYIYLPMLLSPRSLQNKNKGNLTKSLENK